MQKKIANPMLLTTVNKALSLLQCFSVAKPEWSLTELSNEISQPKSVVSRLLYTLKESGFVEQSLTTKRYRLGIVVFQLGAVVSSKMDLRQCALEVMERLGRFTEETVLLSIQAKNHSVCIEKIDSSHNVKVMAGIGRSLELYAGAPQKALLVDYDESMLDEILPEQLKKFGPGTITDKDQFKKNLVDVKKNGYAISWEERSAGVGSVAAPIRDKTGKVIASLAIAVPLERFAKERIQSLIKVVTEHAEELSLKLGYL